MANVTTFHVFGDGGRIFITKNNEFIGIASPGFDVTVTYQIGDIMGANCVPFQNYNFVKICDNFGQECDTNPVQNRQVIGDAIVTLNAYFSLISPSVTITNLVVSEDNYPETRLRNFAVQGTGTGTYQIKEGSTVITTRTLPVSGFDTFDINNIPEGAHTYCAQTKCVTFTITTNPIFNKWSCDDGCAVADTVGTYNSQTECKAACTPPDPNNIVITADKQKDTKAFTATISVSWPNGAGKKVGFQHPGSILTDCINYITLDGNGRGSTQIEITETTSYLAALDGCCRANLPFCKYSNALEFTIDQIDWPMMALYAGIIIAGAYVAGTYINSRKG